MDHLSKSGYSKKQVAKAGHILSHGVMDFSIETMEGIEESNRVLNEWRAAHVIPMQSTLSLLRQNIKHCDPNAVVVQRLKRYQSIVAKLQREPKMKLDTMDDIAGCRVIVGDMNAVTCLVDRLAGSDSQLSIHKTRDYIQHPKSSGYRGVHLIYRYQGETEIYTGFPVEVQVRSKLQHAWATAVEVAGTFLRQGFKSSHGDAQWLRFFQCVSQLFASIELQEDFGRQKELIQLMRDLHVVDTFAISAQFTEQDFEAGGSLLLLQDIERKTVVYHSYRKEEASVALEMYARWEALFKQHPLRDAVLVFADSFTALKEAYPNYFADTIFFLETINHFIDSNRNLK